MVNCSVLNCKSNNDKRLKRNKDESVRKELKYYRFPRDEKYVKIWIERCGRTGNKFNPKTSYVCSKHFTKEHYARNLQHELLNYCPKNSRKLKWNAVPTEHIPVQYTTLDATSEESTECQPKQKKMNSKKFVLEIVNSEAKIEFVVESETSTGFIEPESIPSTSTEQEYYIAPAETSLTEQSTKNYFEDFSDNNETIPENSECRLITVDPESYSNLEQLEPDSCSHKSEFVERSKDESSSNILKSDSKSVPDTNHLETTILNCVEHAPNNSFTEFSNFENCYTVLIPKSVNKTNIETIQSLNTKSEIITLKNTVEALKKEIKELNEKCCWLREKNECINNIFTSAQQNKLLNPGKSIKWDVDDISEALELYESGPKAYRLLLEKNYPLPSISTLKSWTSKKVTKNIDKESLLTDEEMYDCEEFVEETETEELSADSITFTLLEELTEQANESDPDTV